MKKKSKVSVALLIAFIGVVIGLLGELMPDEFKNKVQDFTSQNLGVSFLVIWIIMVVLAVFVFIVFTWKDTKDSTSTVQTSPKVIQKGKKSVFIEKHKGNINIE